MAVYVVQGNSLDRFLAGGAGLENIPATAAKAVAVARDGSAYVAATVGADPGVLRVNPDRTLGESFVVGPLSVDDIAVDDQGAVYAASAGANKLVKATDEGPPEDLLTPELAPASVAVSADGTAAYFADRTTRTVYRYAPGGSTPVVQSVLATDLGVDRSGVLYVADAATRRVVSVAPGGVPQPVTQATDDTPVALALADSGELYVALDNNGVYQWQDGEGFGPIELAFDGPITSLAVRTLPRAPTGVTAVAGDGTATVSWDVADDNGGAPVTRYVATALRWADDDFIPAGAGLHCAVRETNCEITGLQNGVEYAFAVRAANTELPDDTGLSIAGEPSAQVHPYAPPDAPTGLAATPGNAAATLTFRPGGTNGARLNGWAVSTDDGAHWTPVAAVRIDSGEFEAVVEGLANGTPTTVSLRATTEEMDGDQNVAGAVATTTVMPDAELPAAPARLSVRPGGSSVVLMFAAPAETGGSGIAGYEVSTDGGAWRDLDVAVVNNDGDAQPATAEVLLTATLDGLGDYSQLSVRVRARNSTGPGVYAFGFVHADQPMIVGLAIDMHRVTLHFTEVADATGYEVQVNGGTWQPLVTETVDGVLRGTVTDLAIGPTELRLRGVDELGPLRPGPGVRVVIADPPSEPGGFTATAGDASARLDFEPSSDGGDPGVLEYQASIDEGFTWIPLVTTPGVDGKLSATITGLVNDREVEIWLLAVNVAGMGQYATATVTPTATPQTAAPTTLPVTAAPTTPPMTTAPVTTEPTTAPPPSSPATIPPTPPAPGPSEPSTPAPVVPLAPTGVSATAGIASITVSWSAPAANGAAITGYRATASPGGASCSTTGGTSCVVGGAAGTSYTISVVALSAAGASPASASSDEVVPAELTVPAAPPVTSEPLVTPDGPITSATPGGTLRMSGGDYAPFSEVTLAVYSEPQILGTVTADRNGVFDTEIQVPAGLSLGKHSFVAAGVDKHGKFRALRPDLTVSHAAAETLPVTGAATLWMIAAGFAGVTTGTAMRRVRG